MAPAGSLDLPDLPRFFAGKQQILSWYDVPVHSWQRVSHTVDELQHWSVIVKDEHVLAQLRSPVPCFYQQSAATTKRYEALTAAINIAPATDKHYDISQIKSDTEWLTQDVHINEIQALRIALLEWQNRPSLHLQSGYSDAEVASLRDVYAAHLAFDADFESSILRLREEDDFNTDTARRRRQIFIHFQECIGLTRAWLNVRDASAAHALALSDPFHTDIDEAMIVLATQIEAYFKGPAWSVIDDDTVYIWRIGSLFHAHHLMQAIIYLIRTTDTLSRKCVRSWMQLMDATQFLQSLEASVLLPAAQLQQLHVLVAITTLAVIDSANTLEHLATDPQSHWMSDPELTSQIHELMLGAINHSCSQAIPAAFAWALILRRVENWSITEQNTIESPTATRGNTGRSDSPISGRDSHSGGADAGPYTKIFDALAMVRERDANVVGSLLDCTLNTFDVAAVLSALSRSDAEDMLPVVQTASSKFIQEVIAAATVELPDEEKYGDSVLLAQFAVLAPPPSMHTSDFDPVEACKTFLITDVLRENLLEVAAARFPYEALPFIKLCRHLACAAEIDKDGKQYITFRLQSLATFSTSAIGPFASYHTIREDENLNLVSLENDAYAFSHQALTSITQSSEQSRWLVIPANTEGVVISGAEPPVIKWQHEFSGLALIGEWLDMHFNGQLDRAISEHESPQEVAAELVHLLANLLATTSHGGKSTVESAVDFILDETSADVGFGRSSTSLIFDIMEQELQRYRARPINTFDTTVLVSTLKFARALLLVKPTQFWQFAPKTDLVNLRGSSSLLYAVISGVEANSEDAPLTEVSSLLYRDMIASALRRGPDSKTEKQWRTRTSTNMMNTREKLFEIVLSSMTQNMLDVFESIGQWTKRPSPVASKIIVTLCESFSSLLQHRYGTGSGSSNLTSCFETAASVILTRLRPETVVDAGSGSIMSHLLDAVDLLPSFSCREPHQICQQALFELSHTLISSAISLAEPAAGFELCLFDFMPVLVRNICSQSGQSRIVLGLVRSLLQTVAAQKSVSLLGHLGTSSSIDFVNLLIRLHISADALDIAASWDLLTLLINKHQQWLSVVLLTGCIPDKEGKQPATWQVVYRGQLLVDLAADSLLEIGSEKVTFDIRPVLKFVITAQQNWSWTLTSIRSRQEIFVSLVNFVSQISAPSAEQRQIIALVTDLCSIHLQYAKSIQDIDLLKVFIPLIEWLTKYAIEVTSYNQSLHSKFGTNFADKFNLDLNNFRVNHLMFPDSEQTFNIDLADLVLTGQAGWKSSKSLEWRDESYRAEMARANENLSTVDSEFVLLHSFHKLCLEHATFFAQNQNLQIILTHIVQRCLAANASKYPSEQIFDTLLQTRAEVALTLTQKLLDNGGHGPEYRGLLKPAWDATVYSNTNYEQAILNNDLQYWRTCLTMVLLALSFHVGKEWKPLSKQPTAGELLKHLSSGVTEAVQIATVVIGQGLQTIMSSLQEQKQAEMQRQSGAEVVQVGIRDLSLILHALETILRMARLPDFVGQISERLISTGAVQSSMKLYVWAHLLAGPDTDNDPIHADIGIKLLVSLSSLPSVAEELAIEGVLNSVLTARVTQVLQKTPEGVTSLDQRPHCRTLYLIWAEGLLPLCLNLLHIIGAPLAGEISLFLNTFPNQLKRASTALQPRDGAFITLDTAKEMAALAMISYILDDYRNAGASAAVDSSSIHFLAGFDENKKAILADIKEHIDLEKIALKSKIVAVSTKEATWHNGKDVLVDKVLQELKIAQACLLQIQDEESLPEHGGQGAQRAGKKPFDD